MARTSSPRSGLEAELGSRGWTEQAVADRDGSIAEAFAVDAIPESFLIVDDTNRAHFVGPLTSEALDEHLR